MRLADFIERNHGDILAEWDQFAATLPGASGLDHKALRNHAAQVLDGIVADMREEQETGDRRAKSRGVFDSVDEPTAALTHGGVRELQGLDVNALFAEFRALRSAVCRLWGVQQGAAAQPVDDLIRFDEALDRAMAESLARFQSALMRRRSLILGTLAHDLRNPLSAVLVTAQSVRRQPAVADSLPAVDRIIRNAKRAQRIVNDLFDMLLAMGKGNGTLPLQLDTADLAAICEEIVDEARILHPDAEISVSGPATLAGTWDAGRICRAVANLVENGVRHGEGTPVRLELSEQHGTVQVAISNGGTSIPPEILRRIFEPLTQGPPSTTAGHASGAGLGLYIARKVAVSHGGSLDAVSTPDLGTVFTLRLPRQPGPHADG